MLFFTSMTQFALTFIKNMFEVFITLEELFFPLISKLEDLAESSKVIDGTINRIDFTFFTLMIGNLLSDLLTFSAKRNKWCISFRKILNTFCVTFKIFERLSYVVFKDRPKFCCINGSDDWWTNGSNETKHKRTSRKHPEIYA